LNKIDDNASFDPGQGDRIGRIFANWAAVYFEQFFITEVVQTFGYFFKNMNKVKH
jgi:hypothetical protein